MPPKTYSPIAGEPPTHLVDIWKFIVKYRKENDGLSPSLAEISKSGFSKSRQLVKYHLSRMAEFKMVKVIPHRHSGVIPLPRKKWKTWVNAPRTHKKNRIVSEGKTL